MNKNEKTIIAYLFKDINKIVEKLKDYSSYYDRPEIEDIAKELKDICIRNKKLLK